MANASARKGCRRWGLAVLLCLAVLSALVPDARAAAVSLHGAASHLWHSPASPGGFDSRRNDAPLAPTLAQIRGLARLDEEVVDLAVEWNGRFGTPSSLQSASGALTPPARAAARTVALKWLLRHRAVFGGSAAVSADRVRVVKTLTQPDDGPRIVLLHQRFGNLEGGAFGGSIVVTVDRAGRVLLVRAAAARSTELAPAAPSLGATTALRSILGTTHTRAVGNRGEWTELTSGETRVTHYARPVAFPVGRGAARRAIELIVVHGRTDVDQVVVDARDGSVLRGVGLVNGAEARVFRNAPGAAQGGKHELQPVPASWLLGGVPTTKGPNALTATDWLDPAGAPVGPGEIHPVGLDHPFHNSWASSDCRGAGDNPLSYARDAAAATVNLFFHHNVMHDFFKSLGFTANAGAMQTQGGHAPDPLIGLAQDGAAAGDQPVGTGRDNAYMAPMPDDIPSWSGMFLWEPLGGQFESACADGDFDASVIYHEYTHAVSNRWVGAEFGNLGSLHGGSMGESWGDFYGLHFLTRKGLTTSTALAQYATGNPARGLRNFVLENVPVGFDDLGYDPVGDEVHADGEIWNGVLWAVRTALVNAAGPSGADLAAQLIADAMPISGPMPSMLNMRDAILAADKARDAGRYRDALWTVFAQRGMGKSAKAKDADDEDPRTGFDHADATRNGGVTLKFVDAVDGHVIADAATFVGASEVRASSAAVSDANGIASFPIVPGTYTLAVRARGYGVQQIPVTVRAQQITAQTVPLAADVASTAAGAIVVSKTGGDPSGALDSTLATTWRAPGGTQSFVLQLAGAGPVPLKALQVGSFSTTKDAFNALRDFTIDVSTDGRAWRQVARDAFSVTGPVPSVAELGMRRYELAQTVPARFLRFSGHAQRDLPGTVEVGEVEALAAAAGPAPLHPGPGFHDEGTILLPTVVQPTAALMKRIPGLCGPTPPVEGITAHVTTLPPGFNDGTHRIRVVGRPNPVAGSVDVDVDVTFLSRECNVVGRSANFGSESARIPRHTKYVVTENFVVPFPVVVRLDATD